MPYIVTFFVLQIINGDLIETSGAMAGGGNQKLRGKMGTQVKNRN
jgi:hypothetical protein